MKFKWPFRSSGTKERFFGTSNVKTDAVPVSPELSKISDEELTPKEESTARFYALTAQKKSLEELSMDLKLQYPEERVGLILNRIVTLRLEREKKDFKGEGGKQ